MTEYALTKDNSTVDQTRHFKDGETPPDFSGHPTKGDWKWLSVTRLQPEYGQAEGWTLDTGAGAASYRPEYVAPQPRRVGTVAEFRALVAPETMAALEAKFITDANILSFFIQVLSSDSVDLDSPNVAAGLAYSVSIGVMTEEEKTAILGANFDA